VNEKNLYDCTRGSLNICEESSMVHFHASTSFNDLIASSSQLRVIFYHHPNNTTISQLVAVFQPTTAAPPFTFPARKSNAHAYRPLVRSRTMASQGLSNCASPNEEAKARDLFTTMPSEILLRIVTQVPSEYLLDLVQTCRMLRNFIKINASRICNEKIRSQFEFEAKLLQSEMHSGWLVPTNSKVKEEETAFSKFLIRGSPLERSSKRSRYFHLLGEAKEVSTIGLSLTSPGPQFLHFLEQVLLHIRLGPGGERYVVWGGSYYLSEIREKVVINGKTYFYTAHQGWNIANPFWTFMRSFNRRVAQIKDGQVVPHRYWEKFPRELVWFYGVERLRIMQEGEAENWKKMPMLLWE
jgi:hypothetical protein